jgi:death on curing protein
VTRYLTLAEVLLLHGELIATSGGATGLRDLGRVQAALAQPLAAFDGHELYPTLVEKAASLAFSLIQGHPFVDGNKRIGHAAMATFLLLNGSKVVASVDDQERTILNVAAGILGREEFTNWLKAHTFPTSDPA